MHLAFDAMVGTGVALLGLGLWFWLAFWRGKRVPTSRPLLLATLVAGPLAFIGMEAGWLVTEFGRQPWVVYGVLRTADAATTAPGVMVFFLIFLAIYLGLAVTSARLLLRLARRNREIDAPRPRVTPTLRAAEGRAR